MNSFSERNPMTLALCGLVFCGLLIVGSFRINDLANIGSGGTEYRAAFLDAGGLKAGDRVEVAGIEVGRVAGITIERSKVVVDFGVTSDVNLGTETGAAVKVGDLLGTKYLEIAPAGSGKLADGSTIPIGRTSEAYDVVQAFAQLTETTEKIDTKAMTKSLDTLADTFKNSPDEVQGALRGITDFSKTISRRDQAIQELMSHASVTTEVLSDRSGDITQLIKQTNLLLGELEKRRDTIHDVLVHTSSLATQLKGVAKDNQAQLAPALKQLQSVIDRLVKQKANLSATVKNMAMYARVFNNTVANGPWFESILPNVPDTITFTDPG